MDSLEFDSTLASQLGDEDGIIYSVNLRNTSANSAVREYSRHRPLQRRITSGNIWVDVESGETQLKVIGGIFNPNDNVVLSAYLPEQETAQIKSIVPSRSDDRKEASIALITLFNPLTNTHYGGSTIENVIPGLVLVPDQPTYVLPMDFYQLEQETFNIAIGVRDTVRKQGGFYDEAYSNSNQYSGQGISGKIDIGPIFPGQFPITSDPNLFPSPILQVAEGTTFTVKKFSRSILTVDPPPEAIGTLVFDYLGQHVISTIPDADIECVMQYAQGKCLMARAAKLAGQDDDWQEGDTKEITSSPGRELRTQAKAAFDFFNEQFRRRPYAVSG